MSVYGVCMVKTNPPIIPSIKVSQTDIFSCRCIARGNRNHARNRELTQCVKNNGDVLYVYVESDEKTNRDISETFFSSKAIGYGPE